MDKEETATLPPPPPPSRTEAGTQPGSLRITWRRSSTDRMIGGVCGGIARRYGIDPAILRVAAVVSVFAGGLGLLGYPALWLLLPRDVDPPVPTLTRSVWKLILGVLLGVAAVASAIAWLANLGGLTGLIVGGFLAGLAVWLYLRPRPTTTAPFPVVTAQPPPGSTPGSAPAGFAYGGATTGYDPGELNTAPFYPPAPVPAPARPKDRSYLGGITLLVALVVAGAMAAGAAAGVLPFNAIAFFATLLLIVGAGLLLAAFVGRGRWLIVPAVLLALATAAAVPVTRIADELNAEVFSAGVGSPLWSPTSSSDFQLGVGSPTLDLRPWGSDATSPASPEVVTADLRAGVLTVLVPANWQVNLVAEVAAGEIAINGEMSNSTSPQVELETVLRPLSEPTGELDLELNVGVGSIVIRQVPVPQVPIPSASTVAPTPSASTLAPTPIPSDSTP
jgi:phage shock protein PspC (stress-responsive transcriptional regulator)